MSKNILFDNLKFSRLKSLNIEFYYAIIFFISLSIHFYISLIGWNNVILDHHSFRQTQTAITSYYAIKEGFRFDYITPILGAPWSIPLELPIYQWIVAGIVLLFKTPLDQTGRFVTLLFFYLSLIPLYLLLRYFIINKWQRMIILSLILLNPIYLFWSRTFLIESITLFFSLMFLYNFIKALDVKRVPYLVFGLLFGILAALTKITTFVVFCFPAFIFFLWFFLREKSFNIKIIMRYIFYGIILVGIPILCAAAWINFADSYKTLNPIANELIISKAMIPWNFGTIEQRLSLYTWKRILVFHFTTSSWKFFSFISLMAIALILGTRSINKIRIVQSIIAFSCFLFGALIFTNLYFVHDYYLYAASLFISIAIGFIIISITENNNLKLKNLISLIILILLLTLSFLLYNDKYYNIQKKNNPQIKNISAIIKNNTKKNDIILIYAADWKPEFSYYSERRGMMDRLGHSLKNKIIQESLNNLENFSVKVMIIIGTYDKQFIDDRIKYFHLNPNPIYSGIYMHNYNIPELPKEPINIYISK